MVNCVVPGCFSTAKTVTIHRFPSNSILGKSWIKASNNDKLRKLSYEDIRKKIMGVCRLHFSEESYLRLTNKRTLKNNAVPFLLLPNIIIPIREKDTATLDIFEEKATHNQLNFYLQECTEIDVSAHLRYTNSPKSPHIRRSLSMKSEKEFSPKLQTGNNRKMQPLQKLWT